MKLLVLTPSLPTPTWGAGTRNYHMLKALAQRHTVSLLSLADDEKSALTHTPLLQDVVQTFKYVVRSSLARKRFVQASAILRLKPYSLDCNAVLEMQEALDALLAQEQYDAVLFESALMACYRTPVGVKRIVDQHNIEYDLLLRTFQKEKQFVRKWYNWWEGRLLKPAELALCAQADLVLVTSERDREVLQQTCAQSQIEVVPNGVDTEFFQADRSTEIPGQIIFTGAMNYYPNIEAVLTFARLCWPRIKAEVPAAKWLIVGREPPPEVQALAGLPDVVVTGTVPDVRPYLTSSTIALAPLHIGGGTRLKILEALAMGKAVISTSIGCEGLAVQAGTHLLIADQPESLASSVITLLNDPEARATLGNAGRLLVEEKYGWNYCGAQLLRALEMHLPEGEAICR